MCGEIGTTTTVIYPALYQQTIQDIFSIVLDLFTLSNVLIYVGTGAVVNHK